MFLLDVGVIKKELVIVDLIETEYGFFAICMLLIFRYFSHLFVIVGDHPDELGSKIVKAIRRVETTDGVFLDVRFGGSCQGLLKPIRVGCRHVP